MSQKSMQPKPGILSTSGTRKSNAQIDDFREKKQKLDFDAQLA
jgi:hypothetical protein